MKFTIRGKSFDLVKGDVVGGMRGEQPKRINKYYVLVNGREYPIKQVIEKVCGLHAVEFTSADAHRILEKLGFEVRAK